MDVHGPSVSPDEKSLFFSVNAGGMGELIYMLVIMIEEVNLGVNLKIWGLTSIVLVMKDFLFYGYTKNLYFSSDGRPGMGAYIYKAI